MRELQNAPGVVYDVDDLNTLYAEDWNQLVDFVENLSPSGGGSSILTGSSDPSSEIGQNGDLYINITTGDVFKKVSDSWGTALFSMIGEQGEQGEQGEPGPEGPPGTVDVFTEIPDVPSSYTGFSGGVVTVAEDEDGLVFRNDFIYDLILPITSNVASLLDLGIYTYATLSEGLYLTCSGSGSTDLLATSFWPSMIRWNTNFRYSVISMKLNFSVSSHALFGPGLDSFDYYGKFNSAYFEISRGKIYAVSDNGSSFKRTEITSYVQGAFTNKIVLNKFDFIFYPGKGVRFFVNNQEVVYHETYYPLATETPQDLFALLCNTNYDTATISFNFPQVKFKNI